MKKLMIASAAVAAGIAFGDIESSNIVGYTTQSFMAKSAYYMMGSQFEATTGASLKLSDFNFGTIEGAPYYDDDLNFTKTAPSVQVAYADSEGFATYYFLADGAEDMVNPGWVDASGNPANPELPSGLGFWFCNTVSEAPVITQAGQVLDDVVVEKTFDSSYRVLVNPYPAAAKLTAIDFEGIAEGAPYYDDDLAFTATAPSIQIPYADSEGFASYYFLADGAEDMVNPGWVDASGNPADPVIPVGRGCWFKQSKASMKVTFSK